MTSSSKKHFGVVFSPNDSYLATGADDNAINLWYTPRNLKELDSVSLIEPYKPTDLALSPDGRTLAVAQIRGGGDVFLWDIESNQLLNPQVSYRHTDSALSISFSPRDGAIFLSPALNGKLCVYNVNTGKQLHQFSSPKGKIRFSTWSPDGEYVASVSDSSTVYIWKTGREAKQNPQTLNHGDSYVRGVAFSGDGKHIATCSNKGQIVIWSLQQEKSALERTHTLDHRRYLLSVLISPDAKQIFSSASDRTLRTWDMGTGEHLNTTETSQPISKMWFDKNSPNYVMTSSGAKSLVNSLSQSSQQPSWSPYWRLHEEYGGEGWIMWYDEKVVFLPKKFKPFVCGIYGHRVAVCTGNGHVHVYRFSDTVAPTKLISSL